MTEPELQSPERQVLVLGGALPVLADRLGDADFTGTVTYSDDLGRLGVPRGSEHTVSEEEVVTDYFDYLHRVADASKDDGSEAGEEMNRLAHLYANETTFMTSADRRRAVEGLADSQAGFLDADPERVVAYYVSKLKEQKSPALLMHETLDYLGQNRPDLIERVKVIGLDTEETDGPTIGLLPEGKTRLVVLDDWAVSKSQTDYALSHARQLTARYDRPDLADDMQVDLLIARNDQIQNRFQNLDSWNQDEEGRAPVPVVTYFTSNPVTSVYEGPVPTGAHSSVDYGFREKLEIMNRYLENRLGEESLLPHMASIQKSW